VFIKKHSFYENIPTLTNYLSSLLCWLTLRDRGDWVQMGVRVHENGRNF